MNERQRLETAIGVLEAQRRLVGDLVTDAALAPIKQRLESLSKLVLRDVTILIADIVGSTELSTRLDPEEVHAIIDGGLAGYAAIVKENHGDVVQFAGDSLLAVFGHAVVRPNDAELAVHSGLEILRHAREHKTRGISLNVRIGIHTGRVLLGGGPEEASVIRGLAVNVAARIEQTAPVGTVRISKETQRHLRGWFALSEIGPEKFKGIDAPIRSFIVGEQANTLPVVNHARQRERAPMLGREAEFARLQAEFRTVSSTESAWAVSINGEPGIGKSRLLREFSIWAQVNRPQMRLITARSQPFGNQSSWSLLRQIAVNGNRVIAAFRRVVGRGGKNLAKYVNRLLGLGTQCSSTDVQEDTHQLRQLAIAAIAEYIKRLVEAAKPLVVLIEDLHWADSESVELIRSLSLRCKNSAVILVWTTREKHLAANSMVSSDWRNQASLSLGPLSESAAGELIDRLAGSHAELNDDARRWVMQQAGGNAYFIEELVAVLVEDERCSARLTEKNKTPFCVPTTLSATVQARLDTLSNEQIALLRKASVMGPEFFLGPLGEPSLVEGLVGGLVLQGFLRRIDGACHDGLAEFEFAHQILQQVTYDSILREERREYHLSVAQWLSRAAQGESIELRGLIGHHFEQGGDAQSALQWLLEGAAFAMRTSANLLAIEFVDRALRIIDSATHRQETEFELVRIKAQSLFALSKRDEEQVLLRRLDALADALNNEHSKVACAVLQARSELFAGNNSEAASIARRAVSLAAKICDEPHETWALSILASALMHRADCQGVREIARLLMDRTAPTHNPRRHIDAHHLLGGLDINAGYLTEARTHFERALSVARCTGDSVHEAIQLHNLGDATRRVGDFGLAIKMLEEALNLSQKLALDKITVHIICLLARIDLDLENAFESLIKVEMGVELARTLKSADLDANLLTIAGYAQFAIGDLDRAEASLRGASTILASSDHSHDQLEALCCLASVALDKGDHGNALSCLHSIVEYLSMPIGVADKMEANFICYRILRQVGEDAAAMPHLVSAKDLLDRVRRSLSRSQCRLFIAVPRNRKVLQEWKRTRGAAVNNVTNRGPRFQRGQVSGADSAT